MARKYLVIDTEILPDVYMKIVQTKELIRKQAVNNISEAIKEVGISRSSFYKYKDYVFTISEIVQGRKCTLSLLLGHEPGTLNRTLNTIAGRNGNILTINQDIPINNIANVTITIDISNLNGEIDHLIRDLEETKDVLKVDLLTME